MNNVIFNKTKIPQLVLNSINSSCKSRDHNKQKVFSSTMMEFFDKRFSGENFAESDFTGNLTIRYDLWCRIYFEILNFCFCCKLLRLFVTPFLINKLSNYI